MRGLLAIEILGVSSPYCGRACCNESFRLADYFDFVGGTSTGALRRVALGMPVTQIREIALAAARDMFSKARLGTVLVETTHAYIASCLRRVPRISDRRGPARGADGHYAGHRGTPDVASRCNAERDDGFTMARGVETTRAPSSTIRRTPTATSASPSGSWRASTAALTYFPPEEVQLGPERYLFVDGGVTPYNNPCCCCCHGVCAAGPARVACRCGPDAHRLRGYRASAACAPRAAGRPTPRVVQRRGDTECTRCPRRRSTGSLVPYVRRRRRIC